VWTGTVWECPQLIAVGSKHVLLFSVWEPQIPHYEAYAIGTVSNGQFVSERWGRLSYGDQYYAGATFSDADGRPGIIYWLRGITDSGGRWAGAHSVPHLLRVDDGLGLIAEPHSAVADRRGPATKIESGSEHPVALPPLADVEWELRPGQLATLSVSSTEPTPILSMISNDDDLQIKIADATWTMPPGTRVRLVFDGPVVEVFGSAGVFAAAIPVAAARTISMTNSSGLIYPL
jgi:beta-fructofuranosidase